MEQTTILEGLITLVIIAAVVLGFVHGKKDSDANKPRYDNFDEKKLLNKKN